MAEPQATLGADDYAQLYGLLSSSDPSTRAQGLELSKKLTPSEQQAFFDYQRQTNPASERTRVDNSVLGMPPETAALGALGIARAVGGAGPTLGSKAVAAVKGAISEATPIAKYELAKQTLHAMKVPEPLAIPIAMVMSGYRGKGKAPAATAEAVPATSPVESAPGGTPPPPSPPPAAAPAGPAPSPTVASLPAGAPPPMETWHLPAAQRTAGQMSDQWIANDVGIAARRAKLPLSTDQLAAAVQTVKDTGASPVQVVEAWRTSPPPMPTAPKPKLTAAQMAAYLKLRAQSMTHDQAMTALQAQEAFLAGKGLPSNAEVAAKVAERNATGRWPD